MSRQPANLTIGVVLASVALFASIEPASLAAQNEPVDRQDEPTIIATRQVHVHFRLEDRGAAALERVMLFYTPDGGQTWNPVDSEQRADGPLTFSAPTDGRFGLSLVGRDSLGHGEPEPQPGTPPELEIIVDTTAPVVEISRPRNERGVYSSMPLDVEWSVEDDHLGPYAVEVSYSIDDRPWTPIWNRAPARASRQWIVPFTLGQLRLRVRARDRAGNTAEAVTRPLALFERNEARQRVVLVRPTSRERTIPVYYRHQDDRQKSLEPAALRGVRLWYREGAGEWRNGGLDADRNSPAYFQAPSDGLYQLYISAEDASGTIHPPGSAASLDAPPPAELAPHGTVLVDTLEPRLKIIEPPPGVELGWGAPLRIRYEVIEEHPVDGSPQIHFSLDGGANWTRLPTGGDLVAVDGRHRFRGELEFVAPAVESDSFLLSISQQDAAGNVGRSTTDPESPIRLKSLRDDPRVDALALYESALLALSQPQRDRKLESLTLFRRSLDRWEPVASVHHDYAVALETTADGEERQDEILDHYRRAQELEPNNLHVRFNRIGYLLKLWKRTGRDSWFTTAREGFDRIDGPDLLVSSEREEEKVRLERLREQYRRWRDEYFPEP